MNIYHLKYFIDAARFGSVSRSAKENFVSHSAISQAIKNLETYFQTNLVYHAKRRFQLTPEGELCLIEGKSLMLSLEDLKNKIQANHLEIRGHLVLWAPQSLIVDSLYKTIEIYHEKYPQVQISIRPGAAAQVRTAIHTGQDHVGLLVDDGFLDGFQSTTIKNGEFVLVTKSPFANTVNTKNPNENSSKNSGVIVTSRDKIEVQHLLKSFKKKYKKDLLIKMEVMSWGVIKNLVDKNFGIGYVPDYCVHEELLTGKLKKIAPLQTPFKYEIKAIWAKNKHPHPNAKLFIELLKQTSKNHK